MAQQELSFYRDLHRVAFVIFVFFDLMAWWTFIVSLYESSWGVVAVWFFVATWGTNFCMWLYKRGFPERYEASVRKQEEAEAALRAAGKPVGFLDSFTAAYAEHKARGETKGQGSKADAGITTWWKSMNDRAAATRAARKDR